MRRRRTILALTAAAAPALAIGAVARAQLPAFPGAEGFGANALGGRGGEVFHVTSIGDTNTGTYSAGGFKGGTLRYCLQHNSSQPRTIVFDVGGTIPLGSNLNVNRSRVTIAGQTAPGPGVTLRNYTFQVTSSSGNTTSDVVVRYLRTRKGNVSTAEDALGVLGSGTTRDVILDHVSASWGQDEVLSLTNNATNVTVQHSFITEGLDAGGHGYGSLLRPQIAARYSMHHNLWAHNRSRNPRTGSYNGVTTDVDLRNNVVYNFSERAGYTGSSSEPNLEHTNLNYVGNYVIAGPSSPTGAAATRAFSVLSNSTAAIYQADNLIDPDRDALRDGTNTGWGMFLASGGTLTQQASPFDFAPVATDSAQVAYERVLASAGAFPWQRDAIDARVANQVRTNTGAVILAPDAAEWDALVNAPQVDRPTGWDTDFDGMPNEWELARGLNPNLPDNNGVGPNGYTNLEDYLHSRTIIATWNVDADGTWGGIVNWAGSVPNETDATANFAPLTTAPRTVTIASPATVGQLNLAGPHAYTLAGPGALRLDVISGFAAVSVAGNHVIAAPVVLADDTVFDVAPGGSLRLGGGVTAPAKTLTKTGAGALRVNHLRAEALDIDEGTVQLLPGGTLPSVVKALSVASHSALDLTDNSFVIDYDGASPFDTIVDLVRAGYAGASWNGSGINSSTAAATPGTAIGIAEASALGMTNFEGEPVDATALLLLHTRYGDADLSGNVNLSDFNRLAANFGATGATWSRGDFNYDGVVNLSDFNLLAANFGLSATGPQVTPEDWSTLASAVPEPSTMLLLPALCGLALRRGRLSSRTRKAHGQRSVGFRCSRPNNFSYV